MKKTSGKILTSRKRGLKKAWIETNLASRACASGWWVWGEFEIVAKGHDFKACPERSRRVPYPTQNEGALAPDGHFSSN
jgi:hypothetical protein